jgi:hypothetical protein
MRYPFVFQGEVIILLPDMQSGKEIEAWYPLKNRPSKPKEMVSGEIFVRFTYFVRTSNPDAAGP